MQTKGKLKLFRSEAIRAGFSMLWKDKNYQAIVDMAQRLPERPLNQQCLPNIPANLQESQQNQQLQISLSDIACIPPRFPG